MPLHTPGAPSGVIADFGSLADGLVALRAASVRGLSHQHDGSPRQDSYAIISTPSSIVVAVADGVGSAPYSHLGSRVAADTAAAVAATGAGAEAVVVAAIAAISEQARRLDRDPAALATTLLVLEADIGVAAEPWPVRVTEWGDTRASVYLPGSVVDGHPDWRRVCPGRDDVAANVRALPLHRVPTTWGSTVWFPGEVLMAATDGIDSVLDPTNVIGHGLALAWLEQPTMWQFIADVAFESAGARDDRTAVCLFRQGTPTPPVRREIADDADDRPGVAP
jgi:hypothetical protein